MSKIDKGVVFLYRISNIISVFSAMMILILSFMMFHNIEELTQYTIMFNLMVMFLLLMLMVYTKIYVYHLRSKYNRMFKRLYNERKK